MKKLAVLASTLVMSLALAACGGASSTGNNAAAPAASSAPASTASARKAMQYEVTDAKAPVVYWVKSTDADALVKAYEATGNKLTGKIALKITFESPNGPYLSPELLSKLQKATNGTFADSNGYSAPRNTTEGHLRVAEQHGFTKVGPVDILDADGELDLPVKNGKFLKFHRTGSHFANYDGVISIVRFKAHHLRDYGGTLKNLTICLANTSGKGYIHSAGQITSGWREAPMDDFLQSMADAAKAAADYRPGKWVYINVLNEFKPDDKCANTGDQQAVGVLASTDPVALDQAAVDFTFGAAPSKDVRDKWERDHNVRVLQYAEERGLGQRHYRLQEM